MDKESNYIPNNRFDTSKIGPFKTRNLIEAVLVTAPIIVVIILLPFITQAKVIFCMVIGGVTFMLNIIGVKNRSIIQYLSQRAKYKKSKRTLRLRSISDEKIKSASAGQSSFTEKARIILIENSQNDSETIKSIKESIFLIIKLFTE